MRRMLFWVAGLLLAVSPRAWAQVASILPWGDAIVAQGLFAGGHLRVAAVW